MRRSLGFVGTGGGGDSKKSPAQSNHPATTPRQRKRDKFLDFLIPHSRSPSPNPSSSALQQAPSPNVSSSALQKSPSTNPSSSVSQLAATHALSTSWVNNELWTKAYHKLPDELKQHLGENKPGPADQLQILKEVLQTAIQAKEANMAKRLKLKWGDREIDVQETADRLVGWITKFKEIGDIAIQYDPVHAALPWAGVRFILLVRSTIHCLYRNRY
ncbi:hypothetical protein BGX38DRAFT_243873 [Terfezia claveryi]|nr:hypothetical protein BGX38DRAFT_243873 [Terfezia claveryi]